MFNISLLQTNGNGKGTRYRVSKSPFVIGRHESCDLTLPSRTVSRQHCTVVFDNSTVILRDLGSRNGTQVEGVVLNPEQPVALAHHAMVQVGEYSFRVSVRDAKTKQPYVPAEVDLSTVSGAIVSPQHKGADKLLSELDELASRLDLFDEGAPDAATQTKEIKPDNKPSPNPPSKAKKASTGNKKPDKAKQASVKPAESPKNATAVESTEEIPNAEEGSTEESEESAGWGTGWFKKKKGAEPGKLPNHLRQKGPSDSTDAANQALKSFLKK
ncbi:MAG: hypothetical protein CBB71_16185 [Rhodopirellula sp. TMED11]|nr:MAG: hypothetical protein CBB71_16185 [Rhodopirellula sp. TMED11]